MPDRETGNFNGLNFVKVLFTRISTLTKFVSVAASFAPRTLSKYCYVVKTLTK